MIFGDTIGVYGWYLGIRLVNVSCLGGIWG